jgi:hypothetical protein
VLGDGYTCPAGLKVRREAAAIAGWPDHDTRVAPCWSAETATTRGARLRRARSDLAGVLAGDLDGAEAAGGGPAEACVSAVVGDVSFL